MTVPADDSVHPYEWEDAWQDRFEMRLWMGREAPDNTGTWDPVRVMIAPRPKGTNDG